MILQNVYKYSFIVNAIQNYSQDKDVEYFEISVFLTGINLRSQSGALDGCVLHEVEDLRGLRLRLVDDVVQPVLGGIQLVIYYVAF